MDRCRNCFRYGCLAAACRIKLRGWRQEIPRLIAFGLFIAILLVALIANIAHDVDIVVPTQYNGIANTYASGAAANATITVTGVTNKRVRLYAYNAYCNVGAASVTVFNGATQVWQDLVGTSSRPFALPVPLTTGVGSTLTITLSSCGSGNVGHLSAQTDIY